MNDRSPRVDLVKFPRKQQRPVQAGIERAQLVVAAALYVYAAHRFVPGRFPLRDDPVERVTAEFLQVQLRLLETDKRRGYPRMHDLSAPGAESDDGSRMIAGLLRSIGHRTVDDRFAERERLVENDNKVVLEIFRNAAAVAGRIADDLVLLGNDAHEGTPVESIDDYVRVPFRKRKTEHGGPVGRGDFRRYVVIRQINAIIVRLGRFGFVRKPACPFVLIEFGAAGQGHQRELSVIVDPRTGLVRLFESPDLIGRVNINPAVSHFAGLGRPEVHAPRPGDRRIGIAGRQFVSRLRSDQRIGVFYRIESALLATGVHRNKHGRRREAQYLRYLHIVITFCPARKTSPWRSPSGSSISSLNTPSAFASRTIVSFSYRSATYSGLLPVSNIGYFSEITQSNTADCRSKSFCLFTERLVLRPLKTKTDRGFGRYGT